MRLFTSILALGLAAGALAGAGLAQAQPSTSTADHTPCTKVAWVGDSTSINALTGGSGIISPDSQAASSPIAKELFARGVATIAYDVSGGRSAVETVNGNPNAVDALTDLIAGYPNIDCAVYSGGTNDSANIAVGSAVDAKTRLERLAAAAGDIPLYVTTVVIAPTATATGYTPAATATWNEALATTWPEQRVINHAGYPALLGSDGIHYTADGDAARAVLAADVLAGKTQFYRPTDPALESGR